MQGECCHRPTLLLSMQATSSPGTLRWLLLLFCCLQLAHVPPNYLTHVSSNSKTTRSCVRPPVSAPPCCVAGASLLPLQVPYCTTCPGCPAVAAPGVVTSTVGEARPARKCQSSGHAASYQRATAVPMVSKMHPEPLLAQEVPSLLDAALHHGQRLTGNLGSPA